MLYFLTKEAIEVFQKNFDFPVIYNQSGFDRKSLPSKVASLLSTIYR